MNNSGTSALNPVTLRQARTAQAALVAMSIPLALLYIVIPALASELGRDQNVPHLVVPYSIAACIAVAAVHVFLFSVWKIVSFIRAGHFYSMPVERWVRVAKAAALVGCTMPIAVLAHLVLVENAGGPLAPPLAFGIAMLALAGSKLLDLLVGLYRDASSNVAELSEVI